MMNRDMEMSCDEKVFKELGSGIKCEYSNSLLSMAVNRRFISVSPLAFSETNVGKRIKDILNYKKPSFWLVLAAAVFIVVVGVGLLSNPKDEKSESVLIAEAVIDYAFTHLHTVKIETGCVRENIRSERVMIKLGFRKEADLERHSFL